MYEEIMNEEIMENEVVETEEINEMEENGLEIYEYDNDVEDDIDDDSDIEEAENRMSGGLIGLAALGVIGLVGGGIAVAKRIKKKRADKRAANESDIEAARNQKKASVETDANLDDLAEMDGFRSGKEEPEQTRLDELRGPRSNRFRKKNKKSKKIG